jgi:hypothetical protein
MVIALDCARVLVERMGPVWSGRIKPLAERIVALADQSLNPHRAATTLSHRRFTRQNRRARFDQRNQS